MYTFNALGVIGVAHIALILKLALFFNDIRLNSKLPRDWYITFMIYYYYCVCYILFSRPIRNLISCGCALVDISVCAIVYVSTQGDWLRAGGLRQMITNDVIAEIKPEAHLDTCRVTNSPKVQSKRFFHSLLNRGGQM